MHDDTIAQRVCPQRRSAARVNPIHAQLYSASLRARHCVCVCACVRACMRAFCIEVAHSSYSVHCALARLSCLLLTNYLTVTARISLSGCGCGGRMQAREKVFACAKEASALLSKCASHTRARRSTTSSRCAVAAIATNTTACIARMRRSDANQ